MLDSVILCSSEMFTFKTSQLLGTWEPHSAITSLFQHQCKHSRGFYLRLTLRVSVEDFLADANTSDPKVIRSYEIIWDLYTSLKLLNLSEATECHRKQALSSSWLFNSKHEIIQFGMDYDGRDCMEPFVQCLQSSGILRPNFKSLSLGSSDRNVRKTRLHMEVWDIILSL